VLIHCAGGIDRTGLVAALILRVAGVRVDAIAADYAESAAGWAPAMEPWIADAPDAAELRKRKLLSVISAKTMQEVLDALEREHGSVDEFLLRGGVDEPELDRLRARLR
jgi:hypothetical protein